MEEPGGLLSMGSHGVGHDWSDLAAAAAANTFVTDSIQRHLKMEILQYLELLIYLIAHNLYKDIYFFTKFFYTCENDNICLSFVTKYRML